MITKKSFFKMFNSLTDEERQEFREVLEDKPAEEKVEVEEKKGEIGEQDIKTEKENSAEQDKDTEQTAETEKVVESEETPSSEETNLTDNPVVEEMPEQEYNAIPLNQVVLKDELYERLEALNAKFDAVIKENTDLKNALSAMQDKYENKDFGNIAKKGMIKGDNTASFKETFEEYSKKFM